MSATTYPGPLRPGPPRPGGLRVALSVLRPLAGGDALPVALALSDHVTVVNAAGGPRAEPGAADRRQPRDQDRQAARAAQISARPQRRSFASRPQEDATAVMKPRQYRQRGST